MSSEVFAADGRAIGTRAKRTRRRLLDTTARLLNDQGFANLRVVDVTREVGTSPATFYNYFADVDAAVLALADEAAENEGPLVRYLGGGWSGPDGPHAARQFVEAYMAFWDDHYSVLRTRNLKAEEGDRRFILARRRANVCQITAMAEMVADGQRAGRIPLSLDPFVTGTAMMAMLERMLTYRSSRLRLHGMVTDQLADTLTALLYQTLTGRGL